MVGEKKKIRKKVKKKKVRKKVKRSVDPSLSIEETGRIKRSKAGMKNRMLEFQKFGEFRPPENRNRILANLTDIILMGLVSFVLIHYKEKIMFYFEFKVYRSLSLQQYFSLATASKFYHFIHIFSYLIVDVIPSYMFRKTIGKKLFKIRIGHVEEDRKASKMQIIFRECLFKPIALLTVFGALSSLKTQSRRGMHDGFCRTMLYHDDF